MAEPMIFVVDDDESICRSLKRLMRSAGFDVRTFNSAVDFLNQGYKNTTGCLILDVRMPGMNGLELQEKLTSSGSQIPIIVISAHEDSQGREKAVKAGAKAFLQKPFDDQMLLEAIYSVYPKS